MGSRRRWEAAAPVNTQTDILLRQAGGRAGGLSGAVSLGEIKAVPDGGKHKEMKRVVRWGNAEFAKPHLVGLAAWKSYVMARKKKVNKTQSHRGHRVNWEWGVRFWLGGVFSPPVTV